MNPSRYCAVIVVLTASSHVYAQGTMVLEEITVTAQKTTELLQDIPMSVNAVTGEAFRRAVAFDMQDLGKLVPGVVLESTGNNQNITLRGVGTKISAAQAPRTNTYLDGSYVNNQQLSFFSQFDIARFEILRGPQGTLYGRASPTGSIVIHTRNPDLTGFEGYVEGTVGEHDLVNTRFGVSVPLVENTLGLRVAGVFDENNSADGSYANLDRNQFVRTSAGRATLLWEPEAPFSGRLSLTHVDYRGDQSSAYAEGPVQGISRYQRIELSEQPRLFASRFNQVILELNYDFDWAVLTSQSYYADGTNDEIKDVDRTPVYASVQDTNIIFNQAQNQELRLTSSGNDFWDWIVGGYYSRAAADTDVENRFVGDFGGVLVNLTTDSEDFSAFSHNTLYLTEDWTLTAGARWNKTSRYNSNTADYFGLVPLPDQANISRIKDIDWTGTVKLAYRLDVDQMAYATVDRGGRGGGQTLDLTGFTPDNIQDFGPEESTSLEVGYKSTLLNQRLRFNVAAYYQVYDDFHQEALDIDIDLNPATPGPDFNFRVIQNAEQVVVTGAEVDLTYLFSTWLTGQLNIAYNDAEYDSFSNAACNGGPRATGLQGSYATGGIYQVCDYSGLRIGGDSGEWSGVAQGSIVLPLAATGLEWYLDVLANANSFRVAPNTRIRSAGFATVDLFTGLRSAAGAWDLKLWVKNALDKEATIIDDVPEARTYNVPNGITPHERVIRPRQVGVTAIWNF